jgi:hypothetical protein
MGLDFTIYWEEKDNPINWDDENFTYKEFEKHKLCYGRKSWELVYFLNLPVDADAFGTDPEVKKEDWLRLMKAMEKIGPKFEQIWEAFEKEPYYEEHGGVPRDIQDLIVEYEYWHDHTFETEPMLGYEFSIGYMIDFYNAKDEVLRYLDDDKYVVRASISY